MSREIIINASPEETRVVVLEAGKATEILIERSDDRSLVGNVYLGKVDRVLPGMQSAFVDLGLARHAFLHVADVLPPDAEDPEPPEVEPIPVDVADEGAVPDADAEPVAEPVEPAPVETPPPAPGRPEKPREARRSDQKIEDLLKAGEEIVVQVTREPFGGKGARITTHVTFPGKYLVYMPLSDHLGISKRITHEPTRELLRRTLEGIGRRIPGGVIVRTDAAGQPMEVIEAELARLRDRWDGLRASLQRERAPALVHEEPGLPVRIVRDAIPSEVSRIVVDDDAVHGQILEFAQAHAPGLAPLVQRYRGATGLFEAMGLEQEIEKALRDRVWLKSGGYLVINQMEALVAIDVNTGKFTGSRRLEDTVAVTNVEAAREVARQLRLRDLGGIIVVDFIDMAEPEHRRAVLQELEGALARDRARTTVLGMSEFGLVEITRQRQKRSLERTLLEPCPDCSGSGRVKSAETTALTILRRLRVLATAVPPARVRVRAHPDVTLRLRVHEQQLQASGGSLPIRLEIVDDADRQRDTFELTS
jgi:ribonuclease G